MGIDLCFFYIRPFFLHVPTFISAWCASGYADCGPSRLRKTAHEQATRAFPTTEKTTATDLLQLILC